MKKILAYYHKILDKNHISPASYFEWNTYRVFNYLNNYEKITPNFRINSEGKPLSSAKSGVEDIFIEYSKINLIVECSLRSGASQVDFEGNSVYRHSFSKLNFNNKKLLTFFIAPKIYDELYQYYINRSNRVDIIPLSLEQFSKLALIASDSNIEEILMKISKNLTFKNNFYSINDWKLGIIKFIDNL